MKKWKGKENQHHHAHYSYVMFVAGHRDFELGRCKEATLTRNGKFKKMLSCRKKRSVNWWGGGGGVTLGISCSHLNQSLGTLCIVMEEARDRMLSRGKQGVKLFIY